LTYKWTQIYGPTVVISDPHAATTTFTIQNPSDADTRNFVKFQLTVNDGVCSSTDTVSIIFVGDFSVETAILNYACNINAGNPFGGTYSLQRPVANAGDDQVVNVGKTVT